MPPFSTSPPQNSLPKPFTLLPKAALKTLFLPPSFFPISPLNSKVLRPSGTDPTRRFSRLLLRPQKNLYHPPDSLLLPTRALHVEQEPASCHSHRGVTASFPGKLRWPKTEPALSPLPPPHVSKEPSCRRDDLPFNPVNTRRGLTSGLKAYNIVHWLQVTNIRYSAKHLS